VRSAVARVESSRAERAISARVRASARVY
jgi:hypothetical protein